MTACGMKLTQNPLRGSVARTSRARVSTTVRASSSSIMNASNDKIRMGKTDLEVSSIGIGAWSWGDRSGYWGYGNQYDKDVNKQAYMALLDAGIDFIDTAEVYGFGLSEEFLAEFVKEGVKAGKGKPKLCTKFAPLPWRQTPESVPAALKKSLARMDEKKIDLYLQHWPGFFLNAFSNDAFLEGFIQAKKQGLTDNVGVSNFRPDRIKQWVRRLKEEGMVLACNQVNYSLIYRAPERSGLFETLQEEGVTLMAYSPLAQGLLTGKYRPGGARVEGPRKAVFSDRTVERLQPLLNVMDAVGKERGKTNAQIALNWCMSRPNVLPIPGAKSVKQVEELKGAMGWRLSEGEMIELTKASDKVCAGGDLFQGAPFEKW